MFVPMALKPLRGPVNTTLCRISKTQSTTRFLVKRHFFADSWNSFRDAQAKYNTAWNSNNSNGQQYPQQPGSEPTLTYNTSVAFQPKDRDDLIYSKLKDSKNSPTGEDNYFIVSSNSSNEVFAAVADGVGGWADLGYDSTAISRELCNNMAFYSKKFLKENNNTNMDNSLTPKNLLDLSFLKTKKDGKAKVGSTTAVVARFKPDGTLQVSNLGDSWCGVFRNNKLTFETKSQTLNFNTPYQLAIIPEEILKAAKNRNSSYIQYNPSDADDYNFQLMKDDIVILASDGVTDNIYPDDIELYLKDNEFGLNDNLQDTTQSLVHKIVKLSRDPKYPSVFAQEYTKVTGNACFGGKEDDITMVMIKVK